MYFGQLEKGDPVETSGGQTGTLSHKSETNNALWWVDYDDEYGGLYWHERDLTYIED